MLFNSFGYLLFLSIAVATIWLLPRRQKVYLMGAASLFFYAMWRWDFAFLIIFSAVVDFFAASAIARCQKSNIRKLLLVTSLGTNLGLLVFFKYTYFLCHNVSEAGRFLGFSWSSSPGFEIILPLGISFYTFQTISYTIDSYRGVGRTTNDFMVFLAYVSFWPQLIAGPILRANEMIPQLEDPARVGPGDVADGLHRIVTGLFKKVVIADNLAPIVDGIYSGDVESYMATDVWVGSILFGFQIYMDFSGYSDIAIGSARLVGIRIPENFNWPYMALSPRDFWKRWHISLSSWIRDYLYLPLTGQRFQTRSQGGLEVAAKAGDVRSNWALFLTWFLMGLWHGAAWKFAFWGVYHAFFVLSYRYIRWLRKFPERFPMAAWAVTFLVCMAGWIPFRADSLGQAIEMYSKLIDPALYDISLRSVYGPHYLKAVAIVAAFCAAHWARDLKPRGSLSRYLSHGGQAGATAVMLGSVLVYLKPVEQFIYFQF